MRALLALELPGHVLGAGQAEPVGTQHVDVRCDQDQAQLSLRETRAERRLELGSVEPALRARLLALSIAELLRPAPPAPAPLPDREPEPELAEPPAPLVQRASPAAIARTQLWAGIEATATPLFGFGAAIFARVRLVRLLAWSSSFGFTQARGTIDRGHLREQALALRTGPALLWERMRGSFQAGLALRASWLRYAGEPSDATQTSAAHFSAWALGPALFVGGTLQLARGVFLALELELCYALPKIRADVEGGGARTLSPWRSSAALGAGYAW